MLIRCNDITIDDFRENVFRYFLNDILKAYSRVTR